MGLKIKLFVSLIFSLLFVIYGNGQNMIYYYGSNHKPANSSEKAKFIKKLYKKTRKKTVIETFARLDGDLKLAKKEKIRSNQNGYQIIKVTTNTIYPDKIHRKFSINAQGDFDFQEYADGKLARTGTTSRMLPLHLKDTIKEYFRNGQKKAVSYYENNSLISNQTWLKDGTKYVENLFYSVDEIPEYQLGPENFQTFVMKSLESANVDLTQYNGIVTLGWVIKENGELLGAHMLAGQYAGLGKLLSEIIEKLPGKWEPAQLDGQKVNFFMKFPVNFDNNSHLQVFDGVEYSNGFLMWY